jgi:hypothetical protein
MDLRHRNDRIEVRANSSGGSRLRRSLIAFVAALSVVLGWTGVAMAAPTSGTEHFRLVTTSLTGPDSIVARGVFTAGGTDYPGSHSTDLASFSNGAFLIHHPGGSSTGQVNPKTCVLTLTGSGNYTLNHGYGVYSGLTGSGTYTFKAIGTFPRNPNGTCDTSRSAQPTALQETILANGPVSFR